jgi:hypothetical protein
MWTIQHAQLHTALNTLMDACGFTGETGTECMFEILEAAAQDVRDQWREVEDSHKDGLCYDVNAMLAYALDKQLGEYCARLNAH